jgi:hypothetical protein
MQVRVFELGKQDQREDRIDRERLARRVP